MKASVIISTYNSPKWLQKVLWGYESQIEKSFEIVIADDGSSKKTAEMIESFQNYSPLKINHVWQKDQGFQKTKILNKSIIESKSHYLIFTDGDCIPRNDFVKTHLDKQQDNVFLSGGHFPLSIKVSRLITKNNIINQECFDVNWLKKNGIKPSFKNFKLTKNQAISEFMNTITPTKSTWNGGNASAWKKDVLAINGFDERMQYGGEDREFGERLLNYGIQSKQLRYSAVVVHLEHERGYVSKKAWDINNAIRNDTKLKNKTQTEYGISKHKSAEKILSHQ